MGRRRWWWRLGWWRWLILHKIHTKMKKILFLAVCFLMLVGNTYAQKGKQAIGFGLSYGTEIESVGLGLKYQYNITNPIRLEPSLNYFFENDNVSMLDVNLNFHYLFPVASKVKLYPLLGLTFSNWKLDDELWVPLSISQWFWSGCIQSWICLSLLN